MLARHCLHDSLLHALVPSEGNWNRLSIPWHEPFDRLRVLNSLHCESIWIEEHNEHVGFLAVTRKTICKRDFSAWEVIVARMTLDKNLHYCSRMICLKSFCSLVQIRTFPTPQPLADLVLHSNKCVRRPLIDKFL